ncbi:hypothetical protein AAHA92_13543 [Salvia divinorum]|uniref:Uncharacterized protein n=1 Tax=Salvia divinorum TaxID=28513 RepID=A0ABD1H961_SALDI
MCGVNLLKGIDEDQWRFHTSTRVVPKARKSHFPFITLPPTNCCLKFLVVGQLRLEASDLYIREIGERVYIHSV